METRGHPPTEVRGVEDSEVEEDGEELSSASRDLTLLEN